MRSTTVAAGLFVAWAVHDLEEVLCARYWTSAVVPRLGERFPHVPSRMWRLLALDLGRMAVAASLVGVPVALASVQGIRSGARSRMFQAALTAFGWHGIGHIAQSLLARDYTPGILTSPTVVVPYAIWARRTLRGSGDWQPMGARETMISLVALPPLLAGAQIVSRLVVPRDRA